MPNTTELLDLCGTAMTVAEQLGEAGRHAVAVLVGVQDEEEIERLLMAYSPRLRAILDLSRKQIMEGGGIGHVEFWAEAVPPKARKGRGKPKGKRVKAGGVSADKEKRVGAEPSVTRDEAGSAGGP